MRHLECLLVCLNTERERERPVYLCVEKERERERERLYVVSRIPNSVNTVFRLICGA